MKGGSWVGGWWWVGLCACEGWGGWVIEWGEGGGMGGSGVGGEGWGGWWLGGWVVWWVMVCLVGGRVGGVLGEL